MTQEIKDIVVLSLLCIVLASPFALVLLLRPALAAVDGGSRNPLHVLSALVAGVSDVVAAHTTWPFVAGWPKAGEWTISHTLRRLIQDFQHPDYLLFVAMTRRINRVSPTHSHIKVD